MTLLQLLAENKNTFSDTDLACLAAHAQQGIEDLNRTDTFYSKGMKRSLSLLREGADLMLRERTLHNARMAAWTSKNPSEADLAQDPRYSNKPLSEY